MDLMLNLNGTCSNRVLIGFCIGFEVSVSERRYRGVKMEDFLLHDLVVRVGT